MTAEAVCNCPRGGIKRLCKLRRKQGLRSGTVPPGPRQCKMRTSIAVPGWRTPVPTGASMRELGAPLPWGPGLAVHQALP